MNNIVNTKLMTTRELAKVLGIKETKTIFNNAKKCLPNKKIENGKTTFWNEKEVTILLEFMKTNNNNQSNLVSSLQGITTDLTPALMIKQAMELAQRGYELELQRIEQEKKQLKQENKALQIELDQSKEWYSVKRVLIETGKEYPWKLLKEYSKQHGYKIQKVFDKNYGHTNAYHVDVWNKVYGLEL